MLFFLKVWRHRYALFYERKVFFYRTLLKLASFCNSICCLLWLCSKAVKSCFHKKWWWHTRCTWYRVKFWWWKSKDRKCYTCMHLKFHINPPYIVYVINFILSHTFFFSVSICSCLTIAYINELFAPLRNVYIWNYNATFIGIFSAWHWTKMFHTFKDIWRKKYLIY